MAGGLGHMIHNMAGPIPRPQSRGQKSFWSQGPGITPVVDGFQTFILISALIKIRY